MDDAQLSPKDLITGMTADEICELLNEIGVTTSEDQASAIQRLVAQMGSLEAALEALGTGDLEQRGAA